MDFGRLSNHEPVGTGSQAEPMTVILVFASGACLGVGLIELAMGHGWWAAFMGAMCLWNAANAVVNVRAQ